MPYDLHTPFGIRPGQVSPAEMLGEQRRSNLMRVHQQALSDGAHEAQMRTLKGAEPAYDPYPKTGGMVSGTQPRLQAGEYGTDAYFQNRHRDRAGTGVAMGEADLKMQQMDRQKRAGTELDTILGLGAKADTPLPVQAGPDLGSAGPGAAPSGGMSDEDMIRAAILGSVASGGAMPDVGSILDKRAARADAQPLKAIEAETLKLQLDELRRQQTTNRQMQELGRAPNMRIEEFVAGNPNLTADLSRLSKGYYDRDVGDMETDPGQTDINQIVSERDRLVSMLEARQYPRDAALREANRLISMQFGAEQNDWEAENMPALRAALGL
jgi:hypothetical protein